MSNITIHLSPNAGIQAKTAYLQVAYYMRREFENRIAESDSEENIKAFAWWDLQYKITDTQLCAHFEKFDTRALLNHIENGTTF